ncbi:uncharacterized protein LOC123564796 isoform X1 [Mercenaria mercenaria]|uniref:uncharacterized protein LOC123564796 isoform X1 n=1 Tax=Mercenaria mercenaria TaxID=6596 RepID=UPI00234E86F6|nr:uncharacterized protein LOC123564796 isoform X1 [Mercenaria mercenaria]
MLVKYSTFILLASSLISLSEGQNPGGSYCSAGPSCNSVKDCHCGDQCVDMTDLKPCHSTNCQCFQGCVVGEIFILPGVSRKNTYCNECTCPPNAGNGVPSCTRRAWCNLPCHVSIYQENPACKGKQTGQGY